MGIIIFPLSAIVPLFLDHLRSRDDRTDDIIPIAIGCDITHS
ncbi:hypothetical protein [Tychonema sp. LEGE 07196]|nr:hypothetical protein [Tychonema sp. LEGE 07196]